MVGRLGGEDGIRDDSDTHRDDCEEDRLQRQTVWVWVPTIPLTGSGKLLSISFLFFFFKSEVIDTVLTSYGCWRISYNPRKAIGIVLGT